MQNFCRPLQHNSSPAQSASSAPNYTTHLICSLESGIQDLAGTLRENICLRRAYRCSHHHCCTSFREHKCTVHQEYGGRSTRGLFLYSKTSTHVFSSQAALHGRYIIMVHKMFCCCKSLEGLLDSRLEVQNGILSTYLHISPAPGLGRIGTIVALESGEKPIPSSSAATFEVPDLP